MMPFFSKTIYVIGILCMAPMLSFGCAGSSSASDDAIYHEFSMANMREVPSGSLVIQRRDRWISVVLSDEHRDLYNHFPNGDSVRAPFVLLMPDNEPENYAGRTTMISGTSDSEYALSLTNDIETLRNDSTNVYLIESDGTIRMERFDKRLNMWVLKE